MSQCHPSPPPPIPRPIACCHVFRLRPTHVISRRRNKGCLCYLRKCFLIFKHYRICQRNSHKHSGSNFSVKCICNSWLLAEEIDPKMNIQSIILCVANAIFTVAGTFLNLLVIVSFWRCSPYLRSKLCYFMIMVVSVCDFFVVITNYPTLILRLVWWLKDENSLLNIELIYENISNAFISCSITALLVMSIERYLGAYYPFFHRTSLTRRRLLTLLAVFSLVPITLHSISVNDWITSFAVALGIFILIVFPPFLFFNYKLFMISRKVRRDLANRRENASSPEIPTLHVNLRNISSCLLSVGCVGFVFTTAFLYIGFNFAEGSTSENTSMALYLTNTVANANSSLNCLIFFWKNDVLRREGIKAVKALRDRLRFTC